jgi:hypothetical protein
VTPAVHISTPSLPGAFLIHLQDSHTYVNHLVDSGSALSLVPHHSQLDPTDPAIVNTNGGLIHSWSLVFKIFQFGKHKFKHKFLQINVS